MGDESVVGSSIRCMIIVCGRVRMVEDIFGRVGGRFRYTFLG